MDGDVATRDSWAIEPMSSQKIELPIDLTLSLGEFERLKRGNIPEEMEDRWFVYHEDGWIHFHRSWTGFCIYQLRFERVGGVAVVRESWVNRDPEQYQNEDVEEDKQLLRAVLFYRFDIGEEPQQG